MTASFCIAAKPLSPGAHRVRIAGRPGAGGFSLVEVLISIVILSLGLLGMVKLQAAALQGNRDARYQSEAISLARELAEMMRGNKDIALKTNQDDNPYLGTFAVGALSPRTSGDCLNVGRQCPSDAASPVMGQTRVAEAQMTDWLRRVDDALPNAQVAVCFDDAPFDTTTGRAVWACAAGVNPTMMIKIGWTRASTDRSSSNTNPLERAQAAPLVVLPVTPGNTS